MTIVIKLSTGKEIELTEAEYQELKGNASIQYVPLTVPPSLPQQPWTTPSWPWNQPYYVTCKA